MRHADLNTYKPSIPAEKLAELNARLSEAKEAARTNYDRRSKEQKNLHKITVAVIEEANKIVTAQFIEFATKLGYKFNRTGSGFYIMLDGYGFRFEVDFSGLEWRETLETKLQENRIVWLKDGRYTFTHIGAEDFEDMIEKKVAEAKKKDEHENQYKRNCQEVEKLARAAGLLDRYKTDESWEMFHTDKQTVTSQLQLRNSSFDDPIYQLDHGIDNRGSDLDLNIRLRGLSAEIAIEVHKVFLSLIDSMVEKFGADDLEMKRRTTAID